MDVSAGRLSDDEVEKYRHDGFLVPRFRLEGAELAKLQRLTEDLVADNPAAALRRMQLSPRAMRLARAQPASLHHRRALSRGRVYRLRANNLPVFRQEGHLQSNDIAGKSTSRNRTLLKVSITLNRIKRDRSETCPYDFLITKLAVC